MPITIRCHACDTRVSAPDAAAGRRVKCPRCGEELSVPQQAGAVPGWMAAPPPVRRPAPAPTPTPTTGAADPPPPDADAAPQQPAEPIRYDEPEPWYYRFIERVVIVSMWVGLALCALSFVVLTLLFLVGGVGLAGAGLPASSAAAGGCVMLIYWVFLAIMHYFAAVAIVYLASWLLLALDAARNLRRIRMKLPGD